MEDHRNKKTALEVARQCAPVLAGIKPSNLLIVNIILRILFMCLTVQMLVNVCYIRMIKSQYG